MHHSIKLDDVRRGRDIQFEQFWARNLEAMGEGSMLAPLIPLFKEVAQEAFDKGFYVGLTEGIRHGAHLGAAETASAIQEILEG